MTEGHQKPVNARRAQRQARMDRIGRVPRRVGR